MEYTLLVFNSAALIFFVSGWVRIEHRLTRIEVLIRAAGLNGCPLKEK